MSPWWRAVPLVLLSLSCVSQEEGTVSSSQSGDFGGQSGDDSRTCIPEIGPTVGWSDLALPADALDAIPGTYPISGLGAVDGSLEGAPLHGSMRVRLDKAARPERVSGCQLADGAARVFAEIDLELGPERSQSATGELVVWPEERAGWKASLVVELDGVQLGLGLEGDTAQLHSALTAEIQPLGSRGRILVDLDNALPFSGVWPAAMGVCRGGQELSPREDRVAPTLGEKFEDWSLPDLTAELGDGSEVALTLALTTQAPGSVVCVGSEPATLAINDNAGDVSLRLPVVIDDSEPRAILRMDTSDGLSQVGWARERALFTERIGNLSMEDSSIHWIAIKLHFPLETPRTGVGLEVKGFSQLECTLCPADEGSSEQEGCLASCTEWEDGQVLLRLGPDAK